MVLMLALLLSPGHSQKPRALTPSNVREPDPKLTIHRAEAAEAYRRVYSGGRLGKWRGVTQQYSQLIKAKERHHQP